MITGNTPKGNNEDEIRQWLRFVPIEPVDLTCLGEHKDLVSKMICDIRDRWSAQELLEHPDFQKMEKEFQHDLELKRYGTEDLTKQNKEIVDEDAEHEKRRSQAGKEIMGLVPI